MRGPRVIALLAAGAAIATAGLVLVSRDDGGRQRPPLKASKWAGVRGCKERVEGGRFRVARGRDTVIGAATFPYLSANYRSAARPDPQDTDRPPAGLNAHPFKALVLVDSGERVSLIVPRRQRRWMRLFYRPDGNRGTWTAELQACRRLRSRSARRRECRWTPFTACSWRNTQFNGSLYIDFEGAPARGRCAELIVKTTGAARPLRKHLFEPQPAACG